MKLAHFSIIFAIFACLFMTANADYGFLQDDKAACLDKCDTQCRYGHYTNNQGFYTVNDGCNHLKIENLGDPCVRLRKACEPKCK